VKVEVRSRNLLGGMDRMWMIDGDEKLPAKTASSIVVRLSDMLG
jgi:hypothetical protein